MEKFNLKLARCHESFTARILMGIKNDIVLYLSLTNGSLADLLSELGKIDSENFDL